MPYQPSNGEYSSIFNDDTVTKRIHDGQGGGGGGSGGGGSATHKVNGSRMFCV